MDFLKIGGGMSGIGAKKAPPSSFFEHRERMFYEGGKLRRVL